MPTPKIPQLTSWSYSRWSTYKTCPLKAKFKFIDKLKEPGSPQMDRGTAIHELAEHYVQGKLKRLPLELKLFTEELKYLRKIKAPAEEQWTFNRQWGAVEWNDWNNAWLRVKIDCHFVIDDVATIIDYKTGRMSSYKEAEYREQRELMATAAFQRLPEVQTVDARLYYLDHGVIYPEEPELYERAKDAKKLVKIWERNAARMLGTTKFVATPNRGCQWCHFRASNGGPCKHG